VYIVDKGRGARIKASRTVEERVVLGSIRSHGKIVGRAWAYHKVSSSSESAFEACVKNF